MEPKNPTPRIYVACLASYNAGKLHGVWIDATQEVEEIYRQISEMLKSSPVLDAEEWEIHDHEYLGEILSNYSSIEKIHEIALLIVEHGKVVTKLFNYERDLDRVKYLLEDCYCGEYDSEEDYARQFYEECMEVPDHLHNYIDYEAIARDMFMSGWFSVRANGMTHVFSDD